MALPVYGTSKRSVPIVDHRSARIAGSAASPSTYSAGEDSVENHKMTDGERARTVVGNNRLGVISVAVGDGRAPVGFVVPYAVSPTGVPFIGVRDSIAQAGSIKKKTQASLAVAETPLTASASGTNGGVTLLGNLVELAPGTSAFDAAIVEYGRNQPADAGAIKRGQGTLYELDASLVLVATGPNEVVTVSIEDYLAASSDPLASVAPGLVSHLSNDQGGSLVLLCRAFGGQPNATSANLSGIDQYGMDLMVVTPHGRESVRLSFSHPITTPEEVRKELMIMARGARFKLGVG